MAEFIFVLNLLEGKKLRNGSQMTFAEGGTEFNLNNFKTFDAGNTPKVLIKLDTDYRSDPLQNSGLSDS